MEYLVLIDGYNVIKNNPMFQLVETKSLADARTLLIKQLKNRYRHAPQRVIVVFDGNDRQEQSYHDEHIRIIFSRYGETADSVIARLAAEAHNKGQRIMSYSDDQEVCDNVSEKGGQAHTTRNLTNKLNAAPPDVAARAQHRIAIRRIYDIDPSYKPDDEPEPHRQVHKKKKKSSRRYK